ncbi:hypothetical protein VPH35_104771 [Triticum aestivum]|uniref:RING-type domain-containing protein n=1 Tax=Triticum turgidum subsp. durum TaxID=4567 RepID=A0A9R0Y197_TRITD|nr:unnamed protein product [Triticum turgidum subsp. durum]
MQPLVHFAGIFQCLLRQGIRCHLVHFMVPNRSACHGLCSSAPSSFRVASFSSSSNVCTRILKCSICLADYQADERLQRIPPCGHTFHIDCIDHWFSKNTTCPLCRVSLLTAPRAASVAPTDLETQAIEEDCSSNAQHHVGLRDEHTRPEDQAVDGRISDGPSQQTNVEASVVVVIATQTAGSPSSCHLSDV